MQQISGTYSDITENLSRQFGQGDYKRQLDSIFSSFAKRQVRLGTEFEAAIFSDLDSLYEA